MNTWQFKVLYDGNCPICRRQIQALERQDRNGRLAFEDVRSPNFHPARYGRRREEFLSVVHGVFPDGRLVRELAVFREAYRALGRGWWLAPTGWPGLRWVGNLGYRFLARHRFRVSRLLARESGARAGSGGPTPERGAASPGKAE